LPQTIAHSIASLPTDLQGIFWANIGLIGGSVKFPGFRDRLQQDLRALAPVEYEIGVYESKKSNHRDIQIRTCFRELGALPVAGHHTGGVQRRRHKRLS